MAQAVSPSARPGTTTSEGGPGSPTGARLVGLPLMIAITVLIAFALLTWYMVSKTSVPDLQWTRLAWLFSSVEAIAFGAAGAIFGSRIQRERAEKAETEAARHSESAAKGRALAAALKAEEATAPAETQATRGLGDGDPTAGGQATVGRHAALARELFPD